MGNPRYIWFLGVAALVASACPGSNTEIKPMSSEEPGDWGRWREVGKMEVRRRKHSAVLLKDGKVLVIGGMTLEGLSHRYENSCELYDPKTERWQMTRSLRNKYGNSKAFLLKDGKVLVIGRGDYPYDQCELYDPTTETWSSTGALIAPRDSIYATLPSDGQVLVAGGDCRDKPLASCERYDPRTGNWSPAASLSTPRAWHGLVPLRNGKVLAIAGAKDRKSCELYDPEVDKWVPTAPLSADHGNFFFAIGLPNGKVLVAGGTISTFTSTVRCVTVSTTPVLECELYNPTTEQWSPAATLPEPRDSLGATATVLPTGNVLIIGGRRPGINAVLYDVHADKWLPARMPIIPRVNHAATLCPNGDLLISGGAGKGRSYMNRCEILQLKP
ncbi:MAG: Kelch repeat-containing protein [Planctomycetota bacterium]|jgi:hypothetical protein